MICDECETVVHCTKNGCIPKVKCNKPVAEQPAQPTVPDALTASDGESAEYMAGWNDCRQAMLVERST